MSYVNTPPSYYQSTIGPYGTPGWQFAPVPGWGINTQVSAYPPRVGVGIAPSDESSWPLLVIAGGFGLVAGYVIGGYVGVAAGAFKAAVK